MLRPASIFLLCSRFAALMLFTLIVVQPEPAECNSWRVIPIRIDMDQRNRSGVLTIVNDSESPMTFSVEALEWTQDKDGKDLYTETTDILYFPKSLTIEPRSERIVRAGIKVPAVNSEKTYRLYIKQEADPQHRTAMAVAIVVRFGVPIFSKPLNENVSGEISQSLVQDGTVTIGVKNNGNVHFRAQVLRLSGTDTSGTSVWTHELPGAYLLAGSERLFAAVMPEEICSQLNALAIEVETDRVQLSGQIDVDKSMCPSPQ